MRLQVFGKALVRDWHTLFLGLVFMTFGNCTLGYGESCSQPPELDKECLCDELDHIVDALLLERNLHVADNKRIEELLNEQGWFQHVTGVFVYYGNASDLYQNQLNFNRQRISILNAALEDPTIEAYAVCRSLNEENNGSEREDLFKMINYLRRIKGIPQLDEQCQMDCNSYTTYPMTGNIPPEALVEHQAAITASNDMAVVLIYALGGAVGTLASGPAIAAKLTVIRVLFEPTLACMEGMIVAYAENEHGEFEEHGQSLPTDELVETMVDECLFAVAFTESGAIALKKFLKTLRPRELLERIRAFKEK